MSGAAFGLLVLFAGSYAIGLAVFCGADLLKIHKAVRLVLGPYGDRLRK